MGEARQRRVAREAGRPWDRDLPRPPAPTRWLWDDGRWHDEPRPRPGGGGGGGRKTTLGPLLAISALGAGIPATRAR